MRHVPSLLLRELGAYFLSPMAWIILLAFQAIAWIDFWQLVEALGRGESVGSLSATTSLINTYIAGSTPFWIAMLVAVPALTMRLIAEEKRSGTIETLLTVPVTETEITLAKWLAGLVMYVVLLLPFALYLPFLYIKGEYHFDLGPLGSLAIGLVSLGMMFVSIGVFFSSLTKNQILAAINTFVALFLMIVLTLLAYIEAAQRQASWADALQFISVVNQLHTFGAGQLDLRILALHLSVTAFMLYLTVKIIESRQG